MQSRAGKEFFWICVYFAFFLIANIIICNFNMVWLSGDSEKYIGAGIDIARNGYFPPAEMNEQMIVKLVRGRLIFLAALTAGSH